MLYIPSVMYSQYYVIPNVMYSKCYYMYFTMLCNSLCYVIAYVM